MECWRLWSESRKGGKGLKRGGGRGVGKTEVGGNVCVGFGGGGHFRM